ncbi:MAG: hypothetical protein IT192_07315 [Microbacteriaceae bacterium]|nr:hypothetical protein [Microbacteriaceae bacterium]
MTARLTALGGLLGLAWAAALRGYMVEISGFAHVEWVGTFLAILLPGLVAGALLGLAEARRRAGNGRGLGWFALSPFAFSLSMVFVHGALWTLLTTGIGGGAVGIPLVAICGGFALGQRGRSWMRIVAGILGALLLVALAVVGPLINPDGLALTTARGAWVAVLIASLTAVFMVASSIPFRRVAPPTA